MALVGVIAVIAYLLLSGGSAYHVTAEFQNASQIVKGNLVEVGGVKAGTVKNIKLGDNGTALVEMDIDGDYAPLSEQTVATIRSQSLSGIANRYIDLQIPPDNRRGKEIGDGGTLPLSQTVSEVDLDQLFNTLDDKTVNHFKQVIKGFAAASDGVGPQTNAGYKYLNPFLSTSREVFAQLTKDENRFRSLIVDTSSLSGALASKAPDLEQFVSNADVAFTAIASQNTELADSIGQLPGFMRNFNTTAVNLRATLDDLDPLVTASKPVARKLPPLTNALRGFSVDAVPTVRRLSAIVGRPGTANDLTDLVRLQPRLKQIAIGPVKRTGAVRRGALPAAQRALRQSLPQLAFLRPYVTIEGVSGWFDDFGHSGIYDANGGIGRISTTFNAFTASAPGIPDLGSLPLTGAQQLAAGLDTQNLRRCPGTNERDPGDGSTPFTDGGRLNCDTSQVPVGP